MPEPDPPITPGLTKPAPESLPPAEELQFDRAQPLSAAGADHQSARTCLACKQTIGDEYYHAQGQVICPLCASRIQSGQQAPPTTSLVRAAIYGAGAALAGCVLYAVIAIVTGLELALIAIVVGMMVGKAVRYASNGLGGRRQQILAVALTYLGITTSYVPVFLYQLAKNPAILAQQAAQKDSGQAAATSGNQTEQRPRRALSVGGALFSIFALIVVAPFLGVFSNPVSGLLSLLIIFFGLQQAWKLTARPDVVITGPFRVSET